MNNDRWSALGNRNLYVNSDKLNLAGSTSATNISPSLFEFSLIASQPNSSNVSVRMGEILPYLAKAYEQGRQWARDFDDDQVQIPRDLLETIRVARSFEQNKS